MATTSEAATPVTMAAPGQVRDVAREVALLVRSQELGVSPDIVVDLGTSGLEDETEVAVTDLKEYPCRKMQPGRFGTFRNFGNLFGRQLETQLNWSVRPCLSMQKRSAVGSRQSTVAVGSHQSGRRVTIAWSAGAAKASPDGQR